MSVKILLADDHPIVRQGLRILLQAEPGFVVVGEGSDGIEAMQLVDRHRPEILVVDLMMPGLNGLEVLRQCGQISSETRVIVLSMHSDEAYVLEALKRGAQGYVLKDSSAHDLIFAVREVAAGRRYLSPPLSERAITTYMQRRHETDNDPYEALSAREREVLNLAAEGRTNREIAEALCISPRTVDIHRANMMHKLDLHHQTDLVIYALRRGILSLEAETCPVYN